jgi:hypothetical protein
LLTISNLWQAFGGKNSNIDGYMPFTFSTDGGKTFAVGRTRPHTHLFRVSIQLPRAQNNRSIYQGRLRTQHAGEENGGKRGAVLLCGGEQAGAKLPFPALGGNQRPCVHRLLSGNLVFVGDYQVKGTQ